MNSPTVYTCPTCGTRYTSETLDAGAPLDCYQASASSDLDVLEVRTCRGTRGPRSIRPGEPCGATFTIAVSRPSCGDVPLPPPLGVGLEPSPMAHEVEHPGDSATRDSYPDPPSDPPDSRPESPLEVDTDEDP